MDIVQTFLVESSLFVLITVLSTAAQQGNYVVEI